MSLLAQAGETLGEVAERAGSAVIGLGGGWGMGSGVVIASGVVLTNAHNVNGDPRVVFADGRREAATAVAVDMDRDLARLEVNTASVTPLAWEPEKVHPVIGLPVVGLSNAGGRGLRATLGFVAAADRIFRGPRGRRIPGGFEHTALAAPGSSGGPVVDLDGKLVGLNTRRMGRGFYMAQAAAPDLWSLVEALAAGDRPEAPRLGVGVAPSGVARGLRSSLGLDPVDGLLVRLVEEDSAAAAAGIREGDVLVAAGGKATTDVDDLHQALSAAGESIDLELVRLNERISLTARLT